MSAPGPGLDDTARLSVVFAIPGDMDRRTGGFVYEATVLRELRALGHDIALLQLPASFPDPSQHDIEVTRALLAAVPAHVPILLDGFIPGCIGAAVMGTVRAPLVPIIHHPLGLETGLPADRAAHLLHSEAAALRHAARIVVPSPHTARLLVERFGLPAAAIDIAAPGFAPAPPAGFPVLPPLILSVGLLAARKGHDVLLDALGRMTDLEWQARIVGGTHDTGVAADLFARRDALGLQGLVSFTGLLSDEALEDAYGAASIFALATRFEGYGMVFGDAMRRGLPIVTCRAGAVPETLNGAGLLVDVDDADAFADALRRLLVTPSLHAAQVALSRQVGDALPLWRDTAARVAQTIARVVPRQAKRDPSRSMP